MGRVGPFLHVIRENISRKIVTNFEHTFLSQVWLFSDLNKKKCLADFVVETVKMVHLQVDLVIYGVSLVIGVPMLV
jgi:hypothetical protein